MIINKKSCSEEFGRDLLLVVLVFNRVDDFQRRQTIRETWGQEFRSNNKSRIYFAVGLSTDSTVQHKLIEENERFDDIIQFGYYESYYNCTIKAIGLLRWTALSCPFAKYMLKVDDDSVLMANNLLDFCESSAADAILGFLWQNAGVLRGTNKWSISSQDYPKKLYPDYIGGPYLIPGRSVLTLYEKAITKSLPALPFEDVYLTGVVADKSGIKRRKLASLLYVYPGCSVLALDFCYYKSLTVFWQGFSDYTIRKVWNTYRSSDVCPSKGGLRCG